MCLGGEPTGLWVGSAVPTLWVSLGPGGGSGRADPLSAISWREGREQGDLLAQP